MGFYCKRDLKVSVGEAGLSDELFKFNYTLFYDKTDVWFVKL